MYSYTLPMNQIFKPQSFVLVNVFIQKNKLESRKLTKDKLFFHLRVEQFSSIL